MTVVIGASAKRCRRPLVWTGIIEDRRNDHGHFPPEGLTYCAGSWGTPLLSTSRCRWGPVTRPVDPTLPITSPCLTIAPSFATNSEQWAYRVAHTASCVTVM